MDLVPLDPQQRLYLSPDVDDWTLVQAAGISVVIDLDGGLDIGLPTVPNSFVYLYFPFNDAGLPELTKLHAVARCGALLLAAGHKVLSHCGLGFNRSALMAGLILRYQGMAGPAVVELIRERRPGALYNQEYADYLATATLERV
jgi:protein-tyrosine phosphatase